MKSSSESWGFLSFLKLKHSDRVKQAENCFWGPHGLLRILAQRAAGATPSYRRSFVVRQRYRKTLASSDVLVFCVCTYTYGRRPGQVLQLPISSRRIRLFKVDNSSPGECLHNPRSASSAVGLQEARPMAVRSGEHGNNSPWGLVSWRNGRVPHQPPAFYWDPEPSQRTH